MPKQLVILITLIVLYLHSVAQLFSPYSQKDIPGLINQLQQSKADTNRVALLIKLSRYYVLKNGEFAHDLDSSMLFSANAEKLSQQLNYQEGLGQSYLVTSMGLREKRDYQGGKLSVNKAIETFYKTHHEQELAEAYLELSIYYPATGKDLVEKIAAMQAASSAFHNAGNSIKEADCFKELGDLRQIQGNFSQSLAYLKKSLKLYNDTNYARLVGVYDLLGFVSTSLGNQNEGIRYGLLAVDLAEREKDSTSQLCTIYNRLGLTYFNLNEFQKADVYFQKSLMIAERLKDLDAIHELALNITNLLLRLNKSSNALTFLRNIVTLYPVKDISGRIRVTAGFVTIYEKLDQYEMARQYCEQLLGIAKQTELNDEEQGLVYTAIIPFFLATHQYNEARNYLPPAKVLAEKTGSLSNLSLNHLWWFKLDSAQGDYPSAIEHYQQYKTVNDSLFNEAKSRHINQLEILYGIEKKDQDIQLKEQNIQLLTKQGQLQQTRLQQANLMKNVTFAGILLLCIIVGLLFNRYRLKQRSNSKLEAQQKEINQQNSSLQHLVDEKEWLLKEIHHRIKNNLHMVVGLLNSQSDFLTSSEAKQAIAESQHRVNAMSMIHQKLYQSENLSATDMRAYIHELVEYLRDSFNSGQRIIFKLDIDRIQMDLSYSVPIGLILNEAITNSIKYAFPGNRDGIITISLKQTTTDQYLLSIADNGTGLPAGFESRQTNSMGMNLMTGLSADMNGQFLIDGDQGTIIRIAFTYDHEEKQGLPLAVSEITTTEMPIL